MRKISVLLVFCGALAFLWGGLLAPPTSACLGDIDGDGNSWTLGDLVYLLDYLVRGGPAPPNPIDADVDGFPGIDIGDLLQIADYFVSGSCWPVPYTGVGVRDNSQIRLISDLIHITGSSTKDTVHLRIAENHGPSLVAMIIPLSFANEFNQVEVVLDSVSFEGSVIPPSWDCSRDIDNDSKTVLLTLSGEGGMTSGTTGLVATFYFTKVADGDPFTMSPKDIMPAHSFTFIATRCTDGAAAHQRMLSPKLSLSINGDVNCDGVVDLADIVYTMNYLYKGGPPPCGW